MGVIDTKQQLTDLRDQLLLALEEGESAAEPVGLDQNKVGRLSRMDALQQQAMQQASQAAIRKRLSGVAKAMQALADGDYGYCEDCGEEIPEQRLQAKPEALLCVPCQETREA